MSATAIETVDENVNAVNLCRTCHFNELRSGEVGKVRKEWRGCRKHISGFPEMTACPYHEREPGSDDE